MKRLSVPSLTDGKIYTQDPQEELGIQSLRQQEPIRTPFTKEDEARITKLLFTIALTQKRYGLNASDIPAMGQAYSWALRGYTYKQIYDAVTWLVRKMPDIPTPADIIKRIDDTKELNAPCLPPPRHGWINDLSKEIGELPARAWFGACEWDGSTMKAPNAFYADFIAQNYEKALLKVFGEYKIEVAKPD